MHTKQLRTHCLITVLKIVRNHSRNLSEDASECFRNKDRTGMTVAKVGLDILVQSTRHLECDSMRCMV